ncbi:MAG: amino acid permease [Pirellulaceae bacterium]|nr:amino acid permease [Planctomycetales bacterium]
MGGITKKGSARHLGLASTAGVGVGAIVGGGILALSGAAFSVTGPSAILAFALNGVIAILTALSFAEVASKFPQSGGTYVFAKKVLTIEAAFTVGWIVWFASIVAAVLYAFGFAQFALVGIDQVCQAVGVDAPVWLQTRMASCLLAVGATLFYAVSLMHRASGGGQFANVGKIVVFVVLIFFGALAALAPDARDWQSAFTPFFEQGPAGLFQAMGFTFIALQGFDLIAAVGGEVKDPERTIPRAMLISLAIALLIYLPLLLVLTVVGAPQGETIVSISRQHPETVVALAAGNFLGPAGYWLVMAAAILSMLSALQANLFAASRVAQAMSRDHTLPRRFAYTNPRSQTPTMAIAATALIVCVVVVLVPNVAAAGAASSLIFLVTFALAHWVAILVRQRSGHRPPPFRVPGYPLVPVVGGLCCLGLAIYQGVAVPAAGTIALVWICIGTLMFLGLFAHRARIADASSAGSDPELVKLRGRSPLVLVPIANPDNARGLVAVANALAPTQVGRVLLMSVVVAPRDWKPAEDKQPLEQSQEVLSAAIAASVESQLFPESLISVAPRPWPEIARVAKVHRCESLLLGLSRIDGEVDDTPLNDVISSVDCDIVVLRAPKGWSLSNVRRIIVPTAGRGGHDRLLARLLSSFSRSGDRETKFLRILHPRNTDRDVALAREELTAMAHNLGVVNVSLDISRCESAIDEIVRQSADADLMILGIQRLSRRKKLFGQFAMKIAQRSACPIILIGRAG